MSIREAFSDSPGEFLIAVEVFVSNAGSTSLLKNKSRKFEKRESAGDDLKEKANSNRLFMLKSVSASGHWKAATCRLTEDGERCILRVYIEENMLYQTLYIHLLSQSDIRPTEMSLFYRRDCLTITSISRQRTNVTEPLHLSFSNSDTCATWQALLKSYAIPETYGRYLVPLEGGYYRLWRQVDLTLIQGRNLWKLGISNQDTGGNSDDSSDVEVFCEIHLNGVLCSQSSVKNSSLPEWHEHFSFPGLPPFEHLELLVWRETKTSKPTNIGSTRIALSNFRRGEYVEGWFPVNQHATTLGTETQLGSLRLKIRVDEEVILPYSCYCGLMATCESRNFLDWISDLERRLKLKDISTHFMSIAVANNTIVEQIQECTSREVENSPTSHHTLFRGNTTLTKVLELYMTWYGMLFLEASIGTVLRRFCSQKVIIEVDAAKVGRSTKDLEKNVEQLIYWCHEFWNQIYSVRADCPNEMRVIFQIIRKIVEQHYCVAGDSHNYLPWQSVSAFIFLRFIVPAILHPHLFGLYPGLLPRPVQRSLTLVAKVIQSMANLNVPIHKENHMRGVQEFVKDSLGTMIDYISVVSTPCADALPDVSSDEKSRHIRGVMNDLRQRTRTMNVLNRESIPTLPHLLDIPRHLACISSAVIRNSKALNARSRTGDDVDVALDELYAKSFEVEEEAISRVNHIATKLRIGSIHDGTQASIPDHSCEGIDEMFTSALVHATATSSDTQTRKRLNSRPSTAPSLPISDNCRQLSQSGENTLASLQAFRLASNDQGQRHWNGHTKAPSTDSLPKMIRDEQTAVHSQSIATPLEKEDETGRRRRGFIRGILKR